MPAPTAAYFNSERAHCGLLRFLHARHGGLSFLSCFGSTTGLPQSNDFFGRSRGLLKSLDTTRGVHSPNDQLNAFRQALPGDQVRVHSFQQIMAVETLAGSLYVSSSKLGDDGCYLGVGLGNVPVGFDITRAARTRRHTSRRE